MLGVGVYIRIYRFGVVNRFNHKGVNMDNKVKDDIFLNKQFKSWTMQSACQRVGALDILSKPSRMANTLFYPNGEVKYDPSSK